MKKWNWTKISVGICIIAAIVCVAFGGYEWRHTYEAFFGKEKLTVDGSTIYGNYGSFLQGTTASLWSLGGFFLILVAFLAQKQQLALQRIQFDQQSFENNFFHLLTFNREIVKNMVLRGVNPADGGRVFVVLHGIMRTTFFEHVNSPMKIPNTEATAVSIYENQIYGMAPDLLGHYFRSLYHIIKYVHECCPKDKKRYTSIVRAHLSSHEQALLFYNGLCGYGCEKFKPHIEDYALLENMGTNWLMNPDHPTSYSKRAFGDDWEQFKYQ